MNRHELTGITACMLLAAGVAFAADEPSAGAGSQPAATSVTSAGATRSQDRIAAEFAAFAGSQDNARNLVTGLRQGSEITLSGSADGGQAGTLTTFTPPTRPMGNGNVRISLALAQEQLIRLGITQPTVGEVKAALVGGSVTSGSGPAATTTDLQGVLQMRADGMGWGRIANAMGTRLGHVMGGLHQTHRQIGAGQPVAGVSSGGVTTAAGARAGAALSHGKGHGAQARVNVPAGSGIVTAAGAPVAAGSLGRAGGNAHGAGLVTGSGSRASATGLANGKGHGKH